MPADILLGPLLRSRSAYAATIWLELSAPAVVVISTDTQHVTGRTFTVHGHHYALLVIEGLDANQHDYTVHVDDVPTHAGGWFAAIDCEASPHQIAFGSCRRADRDTGTLTDTADTLAYLARALRAGNSEWPSLLLLMGDQIYADEPPQPVRDYIAAQRDIAEPPGVELLTFAEYAFAYRNAFSDPDVAWLLARVPSAMIFDDHDIRDDWNASAQWRLDMQQHPWWQDRLAAGLTAYWVYQHVGNLPPEALARDPLWQHVQLQERDHGSYLDAFMTEVDQDSSRYRFSYLREVGRVRIVVLDTRAGRRLDAATRRIVPNDDWLSAALRGGCDHLVVVSTVPVLLPPAVHYAERWNERMCGGAWGKWLAVKSEKLRQGLDLEHWAAFGASLADLSSALDEVAAGKRGSAPATITLLSGDVHFSYVARVRSKAGVTPIVQLVCSPLQNGLPKFMQVANVVAALPGMGLVPALLAKIAGAPRGAWRWRLSMRPAFANAIGVLSLRHSEAVARWYTPGPSKETLSQFADYRVN